MDFALPRTIQHYTLTQRLGQGGMGVVYRARDERLGRDVALKMIAGLSDERAVKRFWREARAAAAVSHPNVCQIFEVDESPDGIYLAMELLDGEGLDVRLARGACPPNDAVRVALQVLDALSALHARGLVHRDIKPSNVFLTKHGVKLLDFGLAREVTDTTVRIDPVEAPSGQITRPGMMVGTPRYMAPEQISGNVVDQRADLYAIGTVLFEMLAGRPPFVGENVFDLAAAILNDHPPALQGPPAVIAVDRVIRRAMAKDPSARFPIADAMASELRNVVLGDSGANAIVAVGTLLRVVVPPLRLPGEDADAQFLSYGLAEAISGSLAALRDVVVRSPSLAAKWHAADSDPRQMAHAADVDVVISGSLSRMGDQLRATLQAIEAKSGTVLGATSVRGEMKEIFAFEDELTKGVIGLLTPLRADSGRTQAVRLDVPANAQAFELFLRGLELARSLIQAPAARDCFAQALEHDPAFAPAWAQIGRCHRVIGKFIENYPDNDKRAEDAFRRALALSPKLPVAHRFYTHWESEHGRADAAVARLLEHAKDNRNDAQLFAALVHACRYAGLMGASMAAHEEALRLDPTVATSAEYTLLLRGDATRLANMKNMGSEFEGAHGYLLMYAGKMEEVQKALGNAKLDHLPAGYRGMIESIRFLETDPAGAMRAMDEAMSIGANKDPEAVFLVGLTCALLKSDDRALLMIAQCIDEGYTPVYAMMNAPVLASVRARPGFAAPLDRAKQRQRIALAIFERGGGPELLGIAAEAAL